MAASLHVPRRFPRYRPPSSPTFSPSLYQEPPSSSMTIPYILQPRPHVQVLQRRKMTELERLMAFYQIQQFLLGDPLQSEVNRHLTAVHATGRRSRVLDIGGGTGTWVIETANRHSYADVIGIDYDWSNFRQTVAVQHGNVDFMTVSLDTTEAFPFPDNHFDVIHVSNIIFEIPTYHRLLEKISKILKPAGLVVLVETSPKFSAPLGSAPREIRIWDTCVSESMRARGVDVSVPDKLSNLVYQSRLFIHPARFYQARIKPRHGPGTVENFARQGYIHRDLLRSELEAFLPTLLAYGYGREELTDLMEEYLETVFARDSTLFQSIFVVCANKPICRP